MEISLNFGELNTFQQLFHCLLGDGFQNTNQNNDCCALQAKFCSDTSGQSFGEGAQLPILQTSFLHLHVYVVKLVDIVFGTLIKGMNCSKGVNIFCVKIPRKIYATRMTFSRSMSSSSSFCCLTTKFNLIYNQQNKKCNALFSLLGWKMGIILSI